ncbi:MAG: alpha/beta fold hydrolase [Actinomycetota bacterium]
MAECSVLTVPVDYDDPSLGSIDMAVSVHRATGAPSDWLGYLLVNPGGPGESGIEFAAAGAGGGFTDDVVARFDIVGFDPRGVGASEPAFTCGDGTAFKALSAEIDGVVDTDAEVEAGQELAALCGQAMGPVGNQLQSANVVRDMDAIRQALGVDQVSYYGASYGSALGVWYATLFPDSVRAMVIDGAANPITENVDDVEGILAELLEQAAGFETQLSLALQACSDETCPIYNDGDPAGYLQLAADKRDLVRQASPTGSPDAALLGVITPLYQEARWPELYDALNELVENDNGTPLAGIAASQLGEVAGQTIIGHVNCLDSWVLQPDVAAYDPVRAELQAEANDRLAAELPLIGAFTTDAADPCPFLGDLAPETLDQPFDGGDVPIVVVGNTSDPATPYVQSEQLAQDVLANGYLVQADHPNHVVYAFGWNQCVNGHVESMLLDTEPPSERLVECPREEAPEPTVDEVPEIVAQGCAAYAADAVPEADPDAVNAACADAVEPVLDTLGPELILALLKGEQPDRLGELFAIYDATFAEAGLGNGLGS